jgi:hypothetical protein
VKANEQELPRKLRRGERGGELRGETPTNRPTTRLVTHTIDSLHFVPVDRQPLGGHLDEAEAVALLIAKWEPKLGVTVARFFVQRMKTRWGTCNSEAHSIRLNTDLVRKPPECLEYIVVHEMCHLIEPTHNDRFVSLMNRFMPRWQVHRDVLNRLPVRHEDWDY